MSGGGIALPGSGDSEAVNAANAARDARLMATEARMGDLAHELKEERGRHFVSTWPFIPFPLPPSPLTSSSQSSCSSSLASLNPV